MAEFRVIFTKSAAKDLEGLPAEIRLVILRTAKGLEITPFPNGSIIKKIKGSKIPIYRLRVGDFRIIYHLDKHIVVVLSVVNRKDFEKTLKSIL